MRENTLQPVTRSGHEEGWQSRTVIEPLRGWLLLNIRELWDYRELLYFFIWRDLKVRYKQTILGFIWVILQPLMPMIVFSIFFGLLVKVPSDNIPYPVFTYAALLPWQWFAYAFYASSESLINNQGLVTKVYFPRLIIPLSAVLGGLIDLLVALPFLIGMMYYYGLSLSWSVLVLPLFMLLTLLTALGLGLWASALHVQFRDVHHLIGFSTQFLMFATPIFYPASLVPDSWRLLYSLNPLVGVVEGFRWALFGNGTAFDSANLISVPIVLLLVISGLLYFNRVEKNFADHL